MCNALEVNKPLGWIRITHPFHPLKEQQFPVLKIRSVREIETLSLKGSIHGTFAIPREWTDWAYPDPCSDSNSWLHPLCLHSLAEMIQQLSQKKGVDT